MCSGSTLCASDSTVAVEDFIPCGAVVYTSGPSGVISAIASFNKAFGAESPGAMSQTAVLTSTTSFVGDATCFAFPAWASAGAPEGMPEEMEDFGCSAGRLPGTGGGALAFAVAVAVALTPSEYLAAPPSSTA